MPACCLKHIPRVKLTVAFAANLPDASTSGLPLFVNFFKFNEQILKKILKKIFYVLIIL